VTFEPTLEPLHVASLFPAALRGGVMRGLQVHLDSALPGTRERGMAVGQCLMNCLHSVPTEQQLHFDLGENSDVVAILKLARPVSEQQVALKSTLPPHSPDPSPVVHVREAEGGERVQGGGVVGEGMATVREASDSDSDNELEPFDMSHDPDHTHKPAPRYLRDCLSVLVSQSDSGSVEAALSSLPALLSPAPADLSEVCVELARVLLHCQDTWAIPSFSSLRHTALVALTTSRPHLLAPYLTTEFYSPNHNTRQRLDILEVLSSAATDLSTPSPLTTHTPSPLSSPTLTQSDRPDKPWQQVIDERVRAKTRVISKGPQKVPPPSTPSKFSPVAPLFFFPLMAPYDHALPTLDLLGRDSVLLGHMVRTLGHVVWCACHSPSEPAMARALLEFVWALRYHPSSNVRQAVLCAVSMVIVATPPNFLLSDMHEVIAEATLWVQDLCSSDGDDEVRALASHALSLLAAISG
jgi:telomere length regulation protein